jgi:hypothetical protein
MNEADLIKVPYEKPTSKVYKLLNELAEHPTHCKLYYDYDEAVKARDNLRQHIIYHQKPWSRPSLVTLRNRTTQQVVYRLSIHKKHTQATSIDK